MHNMHGCCSSKTSGIRTAGLPSVLQLDCVHKLFGTHKLCIACIAHMPRCGSMLGGQAFSGRNNACVCASLSACIVPRTCRLCATAMSTCFGAPWSSLWTHATQTRQVRACVCLLRRWCAFAFVYVCVHVLACWACGRDEMLSPGNSNPVRPIRALADVSKHGHVCLDHCMCICQCNSSFALSSALRGTLARIQAHA